MPTFDVQLTKRGERYSPVVGDYGQRAIVRGDAPSVGFDLPGWADPAVLNQLDDGTLRSLLARAQGSRREVEARRAAMQGPRVLSQVPAGMDAGLYTSVGGGEGDPAGYVALDDTYRTWQDTQAELDALGQLEAMVRAPMAQREYDTSRQPAFLLGELAQAGYDTAPGVGNDATFRQGLIDNRDNLDAFARNNPLVRAPGKPFTAYDYQGMGRDASGRPQFAPQDRGGGDAFDEVTTPREWMPPTYRGREGSFLQPERRSPSDGFAQAGMNPFRTLNRRAPMSGRF